MNSRYIAIFIGIAVFLLDFATKFLTDKYLPVIGIFSWSYPYGGVGIFENLFGIEFSISHATNKGAAWGVGSDFQVPLLVLRVGLIIGLLIYLVKYNHSKAQEIPIALILAGAIGNVLDYFIYGHVVDMLHFVFWGHSFPIFNIADSAIFIGMCWLALLSWVEERA